MLLAFETSAKDEATGKEMLVSLPTSCCEGGIREDLIFLYSWCRNPGLEVMAPQHCLRCRRDSRSALVQGSKKCHFGHLLIFISPRECGVGPTCL